jgi:hypothetical protein
MMHPQPMIEQAVPQAGSFILSGLEGDAARNPPGDQPALEGRPTAGHLSADSGFDILEDIDRVTDYALEPNIFFSPRFLVPAMPRLDERDVRLMMLQDGPSGETETRFLMPFSIERSGFPVGPEVIRAWCNDLQPLRHSDRRAARSGAHPGRSLRDARRSELGMPKVLVLPDIMMDSPAIATLRGVAIGRGLPVMTTGFGAAAVPATATRTASTISRTILDQQPPQFPPPAPPISRRWGLRIRGRAQPGGCPGRDGGVPAARECRLEGTPEDVARRRTLPRRLRARGDQQSGRTRPVRIHSFKLDGRVIASLIVLLQSGHAWTWKTTYDEDLAKYSPGTMLMMATTESHLDDPNIQITDSCAVEDHPVMARLWSERREFATMIIGLRPEQRPGNAQVASQLESLPQHPQRRQNRCATGCCTWSSARSRLRPRLFRGRSGG